MSKKERKRPIFCDKDGKWKEELEKRLNVKENPITLLALGKVKYEVLKHLNAENDIKIIKTETKYMKKREKGLGLKITVGLYQKTKKAKRQLCRVFKHPI